jgi:DNA helicase-2/ATP-dependent DNA helicase PcrA
MASTNQILEQLNDSQQRAVKYCEGASLVIAGAGSGKTRVLTYKIAYLIQEKGYLPWNILALTFTNKAAEEMKQRIARLVGEECAARLNMGTFHSVFARILRVEAEFVGYRSNYTIYDESDSRTLIKNIIKDLKLDESKYKPAAVGNFISLAKNYLITAEMYAEDRAALERDKSAGMPAIHQVYTIYAQRCRLANAMDFDDLLLNTYLLFSTNEEIRKKYVQRFEYLLVDEYQDTNYAQQQIVYLLTKERQHVCVVGDDAQSIYAFRGANIDNILGFQQLYHNTQLFKLERNYRSTQRIVNAANSLIRHNERQIHKDVYSKNDEGEPLVYFPLYSDKEETVVVSKHIRRIKKEENCSYSDFAILYRTNSQSRTFEEQLRKDNIPYRIFGGLSFYQRKEIKDVIAYFRLVVNPDDEEALRRVINYPARGIGNVTVGKMLDAAHQNGVSMWGAMTTMTAPELSLSNATWGKVQNFVQLIKSFIDRNAAEDVFTLGYDIIKLTGIAQDLAGDNSPEGLTRKENLEELLNAMKDFVDVHREEEGEDGIRMADYLQEVSLLTDLDGGGDDADDQEGRVALMTVHGAKGLEFPTVFIVGMEENIFPSPMSTNSARELEEERRLLYVAITRAERHCFLTSVQNRMRYGRMEFNPRSRFLRDIDPQYMRVSAGGNEEMGKDVWHRRPQQRQWLQNANPVATQFRADPRKRDVPPRHPEPPVSMFPTPSAPTAGLREGCTIEHQRFGIGRVVKLEGTGENLKATVSFRNAGTKQLLVKFAKFTIIDN